MEFLTYEDAVARFVHDGDSVALEGFTHLIPFAAGHEIIRQGRKDLTLIRMTPDLIYDQMIGMGLRAATGLFLGRQSRGRLAAPPARRRGARLAAAARNRGTQSRRHGQRLRSGRRGHALRHLSRLSRIRPARASIRTIKFITCPFTGEELACIPALRPDVTIIHAQKADREGNVLIEGIVGVQKEAVLAARRAVVTVEEIVDDFGPRSSERGHSAVVEYRRGVLAPGGARPSYAHGYYSRDNAFYIAWDEIARDRDTLPGLDGGECPAREGAAMNYTLAGNDDGRGRARAVERRRLLRRHRPAFGRLQPGAPDARAAHQSDLRIGHAANPSRRAAALHRRWRILRDRADHRPGAGDLPLLAAGRAHHGGFPGRSAGGPLRQSE